jgi:CRP-like cAMP-binding protein
MNQKYARETQSYTEQIKMKDNEIRKLQVELQRYSFLDNLKTDPNTAAGKMEAELKIKDEKILMLQREVEEQKNKIDQLSKQMGFVMSEKDRQIHQLNALNEKTDGKLRNAIAAESGQACDVNISLEVIRKSDRERANIEEALKENTFMKSMNKDQQNLIIDVMTKRPYTAGTEIIKEGSDGNEMYILEKGEVSVQKGDTHIVDLKSGLFGELAILYNCRRTATITARTAVVAWVLSRGQFQTIIKQSGNTKEQEKYDLLSSVNALKHLSQDKLRKIADCVDEENHIDGQRIIKQGQRGDTFYIIRSGSVRIKVDQQDGSEQEVAKMGRGEYFGEIALMKEDKRTANVYADGPVALYTLDRAAFSSLIGSLDEAAAQTQTVESTGTANEAKKNPLLTNCKLTDLEILRPLGEGGFGMVKLVKVPGIQNQSYALKCIIKARVVQYGQQRHILDEKNILAQINSDFILSLHTTFKDPKFVYLLTDVYLGGDLWGLLHKKGPFNDAVARFFAACVVEAFAYLHQRQIVYRDLKPENLMISSSGYAILVDLGFAKKVSFGHKTWTFCGTPEYIPPEIISNKGHHIAADYWSLGILIFELLNQKTPFRAKEDLAIYEGILRGIHSVAFPKISRKAESLIKSLCRHDPSERIGYQRNGVNDIRKHRWFQGFDWDGMRAQKIEAPFIPEIRNPFDTTYFEKLTEEDPNKIPNETSGWDADF